MTDYEPGTVAVATVRGVKGVRVVLADSVSGDRWLTPLAFPDGYRWHDQHHLTDIRPLVVLDLSDRPVKGDLTGRDEPTLLASMLRETADNFFRPDAATLADKVADQIETQTKPARIPEPGLWGVVEAEVETHGTVRGRFVRDGDMWESLDWHGTYSWSYLADPNLIREGLS